MGVGQHLFTREKIINVGVYSIGSQARGFFLHGISAPSPYLGQEYEQNGFGEKRKVATRGGKGVHSRDGGGSARTNPHKKKSHQIFLFIN